MSARPQEESIQEQPQATWTSTVPKPSQLFKTCCAPREGAIPITIPVYSPVYNGNQILSGTPGVIPHQQHVFAAPYVTGVQGVTVTQNEPVYQIQSKMFTEQQSGTVSNEPVNVTHYLWTQTNDTHEHVHQEPLKSQGTFAKLRTLFNWEEDQNGEQQVVTGEEGAEQEGATVQRTKRQPLCGVFNSCCMNPVEYSNIGSISQNNTLVRENSAVSGLTNAGQTVTSSRIESIHSNVSIPPIQKNDAISGVTVPETIVSQRVSPQETIISNQGSNVYLQSENSIPVTSFSPNASIVHQTSIPAHTTTNFCNFANYIPTTESFSTVVPSCFSTCYPRVISNPADSMVTMRSIPTQPSIPMAATDVNCFNSCFGYNTNPLTSYQTQGTFGLRNLFTMNPYGQPAVPVDTLSRQLSSVSLQPSINDNSGVVHTAASQLLSAPPLIVQEPTVSERVYKKSNMKPKTFKLHAVEVHQFVPMPQNPTSPFVQTVSGMNYLGQPIYRHGVGIEHPNAFFNPNTTGYIAPVMRDVIDGVENPKIPHMYSMDSQRSHQVVRLETEESRISPRDRVDTTDMEPAENVEYQNQENAAN